MTQEVLDFNKAISSHAKRTEWPVALQLFGELDRLALQATVVTYNSAMNACGAGSLWQSAISLLGDLEASSMEGSIISYSTAISSCEKAGRWEMTLVLLEALQMKELQLNVIAFNAAITACAKGCLLANLLCPTYQCNVAAWEIHVCLGTLGKGMQWAILLLGFRKILKNNSLWC